MTSLHFEKSNLFQNLLDSYSCLNLQDFKDNVFEHITERTWENIWLFMILSKISKGLNVT